MNILRWVTTSITINNQITLSVVDAGKHCNATLQLSTACCMNYVAWNVHVGVSDVHRMCGSFACQLTMTEPLFSTGVPLCLSVYYIRKVKRPSRWLISAIIMIINNNGQSERARERERGGGGWQRASDREKIPSKATCL